MGCLTVSAQTIPVGPQGPRNSQELVNYIGIKVELVSQAVGNGVSFSAKGTAKLPDDCTVEGFLRHRVNEFPLGMNEAAVHGGAFEMAFGPFTGGVYPGLYEVEVVFYPERQSLKVQENLAQTHGESAWRSPNRARGQVAIGGESDEKRQAGAFELRSYEVLHALANHFDGLEKRVVALEAGNQDAFEDLAWASLFQGDIQRIAEDTSRSLSLFGNPFQGELTHRLLVCKTFSEYLEAELDWRLHGKPPRGVEGATEEERAAQAPGVLRGYREAAFGALQTARTSARTPDLREEDLVREVEELIARRDAVSKALLTERKGPSNAARWRDVVSTYRDAVDREKTMTDMALASYGSRSALHREEVRFKGVRDELLELLPLLLESVTRHGQATGTWDFDEEGKRAETEIDRRLGAMEEKAKSR